MMMMTTMMTHNRIILRVIMQILTYTNNVFELTLTPTSAMTSLDSDADGATKRTVDEPSPPAAAAAAATAVVSSLVLRGQMMLVDEWDLIIFLCTPVYDSSDL